MGSVAKIPKVEEYSNEPKVMVPYQTEPGKTPRKIKIERYGTSTKFLSYLSLEFKLQVLWRCFCVVILGSLESFCVFFRH
jgi:hypothetical protein